MSKRKRKGEIFGQQIKNDQSSESHRFRTEHMVASKVLHKTKHLCPFPFEIVLHSPSFPLKINPRVLWFPLWLYLSRLPQLCIPRMHYISPPIKYSLLLHNSHHPYNYLMFYSPLRREKPHPYCPLWYIHCLAQCLEQNGYPISIQQVEG